MNIPWFTLIASSVLLPARADTAPGADAAGLPTVDIVLQRMVERAKTGDDEQEFKQNYQFTRVRITETRNPKGELKKREEKKSEHHPAARQTGNPPQAPGATPQPNDKARGSHSAATRADARAKARDKDEVVLDDDLIQRFDFTLVSRELVNGRPALVIDFQPAKRDLPERSLKDRFVNRIAGRIWVDDAEYALVKVDIHLIDKVNLFGGLVGTISKFDFGFRCERTEEGLWYTRGSAWHLEGREVFVRQTVDGQEEKTEVRRAQPHAVQPPETAAARRVDPATAKD